MRNRDEIRNMFSSADEYILNNPNVIEKSSDEIFEDLDDGSDVMRHVRWGVMVRAKMKSLATFKEKDIIDFLSSIEEKNLLAEYIGYVLQEEHNINLLKIIAASRKISSKADLLYFVASNIPYEKDIDLDDVYLTLEFLEENRDHKLLQQILRNISVLVVDYKKEDEVTKKYISEPTDMLQILVYYMGIELCGKQSDKVEEMICLFLKQRMKRFDVSAIDLLSRSVFFEVTYFDRHIGEMLALAQKDGEYLIKLIPAFVNYLERYDESRNRCKVANRLSDVVYGNLESKKAFASAIEYLNLKSEECTGILREFMTVSFEKDAQILKCLDNHLKKMVQTNCEEALRLIQTIFEVNEYALGDSFFDLLPNMCQVLQKEQTALCDIAFKGILYGDLREFVFGIKLYEKLLVVSDMCEYAAKNDILDEALIKIIKGILYFATNPEKMCRLIYGILRNVDDLDRFIQMCQLDIYTNYPGTFVKISNEYINSEDDNQRQVAEMFVHLDEEVRKKIEMGYDNKELMPSDRRRLLFQKEQIEQNNRINEEANKKSIFLKFFPSRKMKYGKRCAFIQTGYKGQYIYQVSDYIVHKQEIELLRESVKDPVEFLRLRNEYLGSRCNNETDN